MATIMLEYDGRNAFIKKAIDLVLLAGARIVSIPKTASVERKPNATTLKAMQEEKDGEVIRYKGMDDFKKRMYAL